MFPSAYLFGLDVDVGQDVLLEQNDEWALQRRYMTLETLADFGENAKAACLRSL